MYKEFLHLHVSAAVPKEYTTSYPLLGLCIPRQTWRVVWNVLLCTSALHALRPKSCVLAPIPRSDLIRYLVDLTCRLCPTVGCLILSYEGAGLSVSLAIRPCFAGAFIGCRGMQVSLNDVAGV